jgi:hypothetical protein
LSGQVIAVSWIGIVIAALALEWAKMVQNGEFRKILDSFRNGAIFAYFPAFLRPFLWKDRVMRQRRSHAATYCNIEGEKVINHEQIILEKRNQF